MSIGMTENSPPAARNASNACSTHIRHVHLGSLWTMLNPPTMGRIYSATLARDVFAEILATKILEMIVLLRMVLTGLSS